MLHALSWYISEQWQWATAVPFENSDVQKEYLPARDSTDGLFQSAKYHKEEYF